MPSDVQLAERKLLLCSLLARGESRKRDSFLGGTICIQIIEIQKLSCLRNCGVEKKLFVPSVERIAWYIFTKKPRKVIVIGSAQNVEKYIER